MYTQKLRDRIKTILETCHTMGLVREQRGDGAGGPREEPAPVIRNTLATH